jgi:hypothetical protein
MGEEVILFNGIIKWSLDKEMVELELGYKINNEEFKLFCNHFQHNFEAQFQDTLEWQAQDWDEVKTWDLKYNQK